MKKKNISKAKAASSIRFEEKEPAASRDSGVVGEGGK